MSKLEELRTLPDLVKVLREIGAVKLLKDQMIVSDEFRKMTYNYHGSNIKNVPSQHIDGCMFVVDNEGGVYLTERGKNFLEKQAS